MLKRFIPLLFIFAGLQANAAILTYTSNLDPGYFPGFGESGGGYFVVVVDVDSIGLGVRSPGDGLNSASYTFFDSNDVPRFNDGSFGGSGVSSTSFISFDATGAVIDWDMQVFTCGTEYFRSTPTEDLFFPFGGCTEAIYQVVNNSGMWESDTVLDPNNAPTASAGADQSVRVGNTVNLDGSSSFDDNTATAALAYAWTFSSFAGAVAPTLTGPDTATPSFVADAEGTYIIELVVTDEGALDSLADEVEVSTDNLAPTANAGNDQLVVVGTQLALDGSGSTDPENDTLSYNWSLVVPLGSNTVLNNGTTASPDLIPDIPGTYAVTLEVSDFLGAGETDQVDVVAATGASFAEIQIMNADTVVAGLTDTQVTNHGNRIALRKLLSKAIKNINKANSTSDPEKAAKKIAKAVKKLNRAIKRTDGCAIWGSPDDRENKKERGKPRKDWITDCSAQNDVYVLLQTAINALTP